MWKAPAWAPPCPPGRTVPSEGLGPSRTLSTVGCSSPHVGQTESSLSKLPGWPTQAIVTNATDALSLVHVGPTQHPVIVGSGSHIRRS